MKDGDVKSSFFNYEEKLMIQVMTLLLAKKLSEILRPQWYLRRKT
jgi:hypothetical protein